jgi:hypothetical protein
MVDALLARIWMLVSGNSGCITSMYDRSVIVSSGGYLNPAPPVILNVVKDLKKVSREAVEQWNPGTEGSAQR